MMTRMRGAQGLVRSHIRSVPVSTKAPHSSFGVQNSFQSLILVCLLVCHYLAEGGYGAIPDRVGDPSEGARQEVCGCGLVERD